MGTIAPSRTHFGTIHEARAGIKEALGLRLVAGDWPLPDLSCDHVREKDVQPDHDQDKATRDLDPFPENGLELHSR